MVTVAFKLPLQATAADDPFEISILVMPVDDSEARITQSLEEQTADGEAAVEARASAQSGAVGDVGGDGAPDIVAGNRGSRDVTILLGQK